jgi:hypothetical protein
MLEIEIYQVAESTIAVRDLGYLRGEIMEYWQWLRRFQRGSAPVDERQAGRFNLYLCKRDDERRLFFTDVLAKVLPESRRAPLVLFRLWPYSIRIVTALAFGDSVAAGKVRSHQVLQLPAISDCRVCRGELLDNGEQCCVCGNPLWKPEWLMAT